MINLKINLKLNIKILVFTRSRTIRILNKILFKNMISFTQKLISLTENEANICWIVENHTKHCIQDAVAYSNLFSHSFGVIGIDSIKSITFKVPLSKTPLLSGAFMNYLIDDESMVLESNILRNI